MSRGSSDTVQAYAIGDIHGQLGQLKALHAAIAADRRAHGVAPEVPVIHLGDLIDRGPDSAGVIDFVLAGRARGENWIVLRGNHDLMLLDILEDRAGPAREAMWLGENWGGRATLASYGIGTDPAADPSELCAMARSTVPAKHLAFLRALPVTHRRGPVLYVHAGIRPGVPLDAQDPDDLVWIREPFLSDPRDHGVLVVHGHTAIRAPTHYGNRVNLDSGAGWGRQASAAFLSGRAVFVVETGGRRRPLRPGRGAG